MKEYETVMDAEFEPFDDDLKKIMKNRYQDESHLFTPEAQEQRRRNREKFTLKIAAFMACLIGFVSWLNGMGMMSGGWYGFWVSVFSIAVGYNFGVCVCHNKGWRGA